MFVRPKRHKIAYLSDQDIQTSILSDHDNPCLCGIFFALNIGETWPAV